MNGCFDKGHAYTGLSRVKDWNCLQIVGFQEAYLRTDGLVDRFHKAIEKGEDSVKSFLINDAGVWWYCFLGQSGKLCPTASRRSGLNQFQKWIMKHGPGGGYSGHYGRLGDGWVEVALGKV